MFAFLKPKTAANENQLPACVACGLLTSCKNPMQKAPEGQCDTVIVLNAPASDSVGLPDERLKRLFEGYNKTVGKHKVIFASACPGENDKAWKHCQPLMIQQIKAANPKRIITYGKYATRSVVSWLWNKNPTKLDVWYGARIPCRQLNAWVLPIGTISRKVNKDTSLIWFHKHRAAALEINDRPYDVVRPYEERVQRLWDSSEIEAACAKASASPLSAFDYETTGLKPENPKQLLISASVAWLEGNTAKCAAWMLDDDRKVDALKRYLTSDSRKIAANAKFENRWTRTKLGVNVNKWCWDTALAAHMLDPSEGVVSLKHQAFARLGQRFYAGDVDKVFESQDEHGLNGIRGLNKHVLLQYNGMDSILELDLGIMQMYEAGLTKLWTDTMPNQRFYAHGAYYGR